MGVIDAAVVREMTPAELLGVATLFGRAVRREDWSTARRALAVLNAGWYALDAAGRAALQAAVMARVERG